MYDYKKKYQNVNLLNNYMLARTLSMFEYMNLPNTIPPTELEKHLQTHGYTFITEVDGQLYAFYGGLGGEPDVYGQPTTININNATLSFSKTLNIHEDGVLIKNDDMMLGLKKLYDKYNTLLIENEITMYLNTFNSRIQTLISAGDDTTRESAELYIKKIIAGELGIIGENRLFEGITAQNSHTGSSNVTQQIIELNQYVKASLFNEVGLNANFNMKRSRLNDSESEMNVDSLHPLIDNMLLNRKRGIEKLNEKYGLNVSVEFGSIWKVRNIKDIESVTDELESEQVESELEQVEFELEQVESELEQDESELEQVESELEQDEIAVTDEEGESKHDVQ